MTGTLMVLVFTIATAGPGLAQPLFTDALPREEFAARRAKVMSQIGTVWQSSRGRPRPGRR